MSDYLQKSVNELALPSEINHNVVLFHYLRGSNDNPYKLRRTKVALDSRTELFKLGKGIVDINSDLEHIELDIRAMQEYIKYIDRENTFLSLIVQNFQESHKKNLSLEHYLGRLSIIDDDNYVLEENSIIDTNCNVEWRIDKKSAKILSSVSLNNEEIFFDSIYRNKIIDLKWKNAFEYARANLFGRLDNIEKTFQEKTKLWSLISSIQGILVFLSAVNGSKNLQSTESAMSCSFLVVKKLGRTNTSKKKKNDETELLITIVSPALNYSSEQIDACKNNAYKTFDSIDDQRKTGGDFTNKLNRILSPINDNIVDNECFKPIREYVYHSSTKKTNIDEAKWAILLTNYLINKKHEGKSLDFFIVCGELSQFKDLLQIKFRDLNEENKVSLKWKDEDENEDEDEDELIQAEKVARQIAHEHYPWFESGRYALFWNTASTKDDNAPVGLISIEHFSWINIVESRFQYKLPFEMPNCLICHIYGDPQKIGVQIVKDKQVKNLLRWQDNRWKFITNESRRSDLEKVLNKLLKIKADININRIIEIILRVSEHPEKGGTIVFVENDNIMNEFGDYQKNMGEPWHLKDMNPEDVIALISQDGATLCPVDTTNSACFDLQSLQYRKLLLSTNSALKLLSIIEQNWDSTISHQKADWPLYAKGSRRWNAAIAACNYLVNTVLVISQDGDIQIWHIDNNNMGKDVYSLEGISCLEIYELPLQGDIKMLGIYPKPENYTQNSLQIDLL
jgi:hypothetical protein